MLHVLSSLPVEYESIVETLERDLGEGLLTFEDLKEQVRSKYRRLTKKMNVKEDELAFTVLIKKFNKKQGFKGNCRICGKYGHKAADCWENKINKNKKFNQGGGNKEWQFKGKCNFCGIYGHKERDCHKKKAQENEENNTNVAAEEEAEETVLLTVNENQFNDKVRRALLLDHYENVASIYMETQEIENLNDDGKPSEETNDHNNDNNDINNNRRENVNEVIDLQSETVQNMIADQDRAEEQDRQNDINDAVVNQDTELDLVPIPQDISMELMNNNENLRQAIIADINLMSHMGRRHRFLPL